MGDPLSKNAEVLSYAAVATAREVVPYSAAHVDTTLREDVATRNAVVTSPNLRGLAATEVAKYKATGDLNDFIIATAIEAFLRLKADEIQLTECIETMVYNPIDYNLGCTIGWHVGVVETIKDALDGYKEMLSNLREFVLEDFPEFYSDYWSAITDLETLTRITLAIKNSGDRSLEETILRIYEAVASKHSDLAAIVLDVLDRFNQLNALRQLFEERSYNEVIKAIIADLGETLSTYWQNDIDRYLALRKNAYELGKALGYDYGRLCTEIALTVVGL